MGRTQDHDKITQLLRRMSAAWNTGRFDELQRCFHPDAVIMPPGFSMRVQGREACVRSYQDFMSVARVTAYYEAEPTIEVWGDTGVATFRWDMSWEMNGEAHRESGHDVVIFARQVNQWLVVWRTVVQERASI